jgi:hypothetical protein
MLKERPVAKIKPLLSSCILSDAYTSGPFLNTFLHAAAAHGESECRTN